MKPQSRLKNEKENHNRAACDNIGGVGICIIIMRSKTGRHVRQPMLLGKTREGLSNQCRNQRNSVTLHDTI